MFAVGAIRFECYQGWFHSEGAAQFARCDLQCGFNRSRALDSLRDEVQSFLLLGAESRQVFIAFTFGNIRN